jgi:transcriptional regulatory protein RtcR
VIRCCSWDQSALASPASRRIYEVKKARHTVQGRFVDVNCATYAAIRRCPTLFGHMKGAFTGAQKDRAGLLRTPNSGVLFLDGIGDLGIDEQAMLLRALEEKTFMPPGSDEEAYSDFQLITGRNRDLQGAVRKAAP